MMNKIKVSEEIYQYFKQDIFTQSLLEKFEIHSSNNSNTIVSIDDDLVLDIREWAIEKQLKVGFDENYHLTKEGKILEIIIDAFDI